MRGLSKGRTRVVLVVVVVVVPLRTWRAPHIYVSHFFLVLVCRSARCLSLFFLSLFSFSFSPSSLLRVVGGKRAHQENVLSSRKEGTGRNVGKLPVLPVLSLFSPLSLLHLSSLSLCLPSSLSSPFLTTPCPSSSFQAHLYVLHSLTTPNVNETDYSLGNVSYMKQKRLTSPPAATAEDDTTGIKKKPPTATPVAKKKKQKFSEEFAKRTWLSTPVDPSTAVKAAESSQSSQSSQPSASADADAPREYKNPVDQVRIDEEFQAFVRDYSQSGTDSKQMAVQYLRRSAPFKGTHIKGYKATLKEAGLRWWKNEDHIQNDRSSPFGWFVACCLADLKRVLQLPLTKSGEKAWFPVDIPEEDSAIVCRYVLEVIDEFEDRKRQKLERDRLAALNSKTDKEKRLRQDAAGMVVDDRPEEIAKLVDKLSVSDDNVWKYDAELIKKSATSDRLGPAMSTNALRVLRALHLKILTPEEVRAGDFQGVDIRSINADRMKRERASVASVAAAAAPASSSSSSAPRPVKKAKVAVREEDIDHLKMYEQTRVYLKTDEELESESKDQQDEASGQAKDDANAQKEMFAKAAEMAKTLKSRQRKPTICGECQELVNEQFGCSCLRVDWVTCYVCFQATNSKMKTCMCACNVCPDVTYPVEAAEEPSETTEEKTQVKETFPRKEANDQDAVEEEKEEEEERQRKSASKMSDKARGKQKQSLRFVKLTPVDEDL